MSDVKSISKDNEEQDLVDKAEEAAEIQQQIVKLRKEKKKKLNNKSEQKTSSEPNDRTKYLTGTVESLEKDDFENVIVTVRYTLNGEQNSEIFNLNMPEDPEDYSISNEYVRLRESVGIDGESSLIARDVPLKLDQNGSVSLDIPKNPTYTNRLYKKIKRGILSTESYRYIYRIINNDSKIPMRCLGGVAMIPPALIILLNGFSEIGLKFLIDFMLSSFYALVFFGIVVSSEYMFREKFTLSGLLTLVSGTITSYLVTTNRIPTVWIGSENPINHNILTASQYAVAVCLIIFTYLFIYSSKVDTLEIIKSKLSNLKGWINKKRGVEFVR